MVIGVTGYVPLTHKSNRQKLTPGCRNGQVAKGVLEILRELPIVEVDVAELPSLVSDPGKWHRFLSTISSLTMP
jgi:hypothetical protein